MKQLKMERKLKKELNCERYRHTLGVMYTAASLAMAYHVDIKKAMCAGLLHDCAKCISDNKKLKLCKKHKIAVSALEKQNPFLLHAKLGAYFAKHKYGIKDKEILHAIQVHTTGEPEMNTMDKIIYVADYIEPNREKAPNLKKIRELAFQDLDSAMLRILSDTLEYLEKKGGEIDPLTLETYHYFQNQLE